MFSTQTDENLLNTIFGNYENEFNKNIFDDADNFMPFSLNCKRMHSILVDQQIFEEFEDFMPPTKR
jgi:hypothetical protein